MRKEQHEYEGRKYLTGAEAAALLGVNPLLKVNYRSTPRSH